MTLYTGNIMYQLPNLNTYKDQSPTERLRIEQYLINCVYANSYYNINIVGGQRHIGLARLTKLTFTVDGPHIEFKMINEEVIELPINVIISIALPHN